MSGCTLEVNTLVDYNYSYAKIVRLLNSFGVNLSADDIKKLQQIFPTAWDFREVLFAHVLWCLKIDRQLAVGDVVSYSSVSIGTVVWFTGKTIVIRPIGGGKAKSFQAWRFALYGEILDRFSNYSTLSYDEFLKLMKVYYALHGKYSLVFPER